MFSGRTNWNLASTPFARAIEQHRRSGRELLDLSASNPTRIGLRFNDSEILRALSNPRALEYAPDPKGLISARNAVAEYYAERLPASGRARLDAENIILTTSTSEAYSFIFRLLCNPGDEVLVPAPSYPLFDFLAGLEDVGLRSYPLLYDHGWHLDLHSLEHAITAQTRAVLVVNPNNPTGSYVHASELAALNRICSGKGLALISDEVFLDYDHGGANASTTLACNSAVLTFTLSGISKICALPQMKFSWMVVSGPPRDVTPALERLEVVADTYLSMNAPIQWAAPVLLAERSSMRAQLMQRIRQNLAELDRQLAGQSVCARLEIEAGWYAILRVPAIGSDEDLAVKLLHDCSVLVHPGHFYNFAGDGFLVLSLIPTETEFAEGVRRILGSVAVYSA